MESLTEERINKLTSAVAELGASQAKLWSVQANGIPPHKSVVRIMNLSLILSTFSLIFGAIISIEMYLLLSKVHTILSLM